MPGQQKQVFLNQVRGEMQAGREKRANRQNPESGGI